MEGEMVRVWHPALEDVKNKQKDILSWPDDSK
jgi:hypothetical protein